MSKYINLARHLQAANAASWTACFAEIETILGFPLPRSAYTYPAWWSNQAGDGHSQTQAWQSVGWRTGNLDLGSQKITFSRDSNSLKPLPSSVGRQAALAEYSAKKGAGSPQSEAPDIQGHRAGLSITEAKAGLAAHFGVPPESIEITIKG